MVPKISVENDYDEFIFDALDNVVMKLEEKYTYVYYLKSYYQIDLPSKDHKGISTKEIHYSTMLMNNIASST